MTRMILALMIFASIALSGCFRNDTKSFVIATPQMEDEACADIITATVGGLRGVLEYSIDREERTVWVRYNSLSIAEKNVENAIAMAGFDANSVLAYPGSRKLLLDRLKQERE